MDQTTFYQADLESPRQEFFLCGLGFAVALLVCSGIDFLCARTGGAIQLYEIFPHPGVALSGKIILEGTWVVRFCSQW